MSENVIIWPKYNKAGKKVQCGRINGVPFKVIWNQCSKWADCYVADKIKNCPEIFGIE